MYIFATGAALVANGITSFFVHTLPAKVEASLLMSSPVDW